MAGHVDASTGRRERGAAGQKPTGAQVGGDGLGAVDCSDGKGKYGAVAAAELFDGSALDVCVAIGDGGHCKDHLLASILAESGATRENDEKYELLTSSISSSIVEHLLLAQEILE